jgi:hypothetical protein
LFDTSKRKILSTRSDAEFSSGESAAGGGANPLPCAYFLYLQNKYIYRFARWIKGKAARVNMRWPKTPGSL